MSIELESKKPPLLNLLSFNRNYWLLLLINALDRVAWWMIIIQLPIYISQKGIPGGLGWEQSTKAVIYFLWVVMQNFSPIFLGTLADKYGRKRSLLLSAVLIASSYYLLSQATDVVSFTAVILMLSVGYGLFRPALLGFLSDESAGENSTLGWGMYYWAANSAVFFVGTPVMMELKSLSWEWIFIGSSLFVLANTIVIMLLKDTRRYTASNESKNLLYGLALLKEKKNLVLVFSMAAFFLIYMLTYEFLPNFIYDWGRTGDLIVFFDVDEKFIQLTHLGLTVTYEWFYYLNSGITLIFLPFISYLLIGNKSVTTLITGMYIVLFGFALATLNDKGILIAGGFFIYTFGEMITNMKYSEHLGHLSESTNRSAVMALLSLSMLIGYSAGSVYSGMFFSGLAERATILEAGYNINYAELWEATAPYKFWIPVIAAGALGISGLYSYRKMVRNSGIRTGI